MEFAVEPLATAVTLAYAYAVLVRFASDSVMVESSRDLPRWTVRTFGSDKGRAFVEQLETPLPK